MPRKYSGNSGIHFHSELPLVSAMLQCQLHPGGECVCGDPNVHGYCSGSQCAPDDFNNSCISSGKVSDEKVILFDSNAYLNLLEGPNSVWVSRDIDNDQIEVRSLLSAFIGHFQLRLFYAVASARR